MGAYENQEVIVSLDDFENPNNELNVTLNPNPVQSKVCFEYSLTKPTHVIMKITDQQGRLIETLVNSHQDWGPKKVIWDANHLKSGIYFCRIIAGDRKMIRKFIKVN